MNRKKVFGVLFFIALLATAYFLRASWLPYAAEILIVDEAPVPSDLIVVLNGHNAKRRIQHAVSLYQQKFAPKVLISGSWDLEKETNINMGKVYALSLGVPEQDLWLENESGSTYENALYLVPVLEKKQVRSFLLVTSPSHTLRSKKIFERIIPKTIQWRISSGAIEADTKNWWHSVITCREVLYEYLNLVFLLVRQK